MSYKVNKFDGDFIAVSQIWGHKPDAHSTPDYNEALDFIKYDMQYRLPNEKAMAFILNDKQQLVYRTEVGPDENS